MRISNYTRWYVIAALAGALMAAACSGPVPTSEDAEEPEATEQEPETPVTRTVQGFRIQIYSTSEKSAADEQLEEALEWWEDVPRPDRPEHMTSDELPVEIKWQQPYYRVRLGNFTTRSEAERALELVTDRFPNAFIVPDMVTITR